MVLAVAKTRKGIKKFYAGLGAETRSFFSEVPNLVDSEFSLDIALAYVFFRLELGQRRALYCGARKLHRTESALTWRAIDEHDLTRADFKELFKTIYGFSVSKVASTSLTGAEAIRDKLLHGKGLSEKEMREAICKALHYADKLNDLIGTKKGVGVTPFTRDLRGFTGRLEALDKSTTRWILKGMGFSLS